MDILKQFFCRIFFALAFYLLFFPTGLAAGIYKCTQPDGSLQFSDVWCKQGVVEPVVLFENSALDSTVERNNITRYHQKRNVREQNKPRKQEQSVLVISDTYTEERNARVTAAEKKASKKRKSAAKRKNKRADAEPCGLDIFY